MNVNIAQAAKVFFPSSSLEMVYNEAIKNSIDAGASVIKLTIKLKSYADVESLVLQITDNGQGFDDKNLQKFSELLKIDTPDHKGLGRLVYLNYFNNVEISSIYPVQYAMMKRVFTFNGNFSQENCQEPKETTDERNTSLTFKEYKLQKLHSYDSVRASSIKRSLLLEFYPLFYRLKIEKKELKIKIVVKTETPSTEYDFKSDTQEIDVATLPALNEEPLDFKLSQDLLSEFKILYSVTKKNATLESQIVTAVCVDERTKEVDILSKGGIPKGYDVIFILYSSFFTGQVDASRQKLTIDDGTLKPLTKAFGSKVSEILNKEIPEIHKQNEEVTAELDELYPHLHGLFEKNPVGLVDKNQSYEVAQNRFLKAQKEILDAESLSDDQYEESIGISSRLLTEYILYRNKIIQKLKSIDPSKNEEDIHNIIVPKRKILKKDDFINDIYINNAWLLDDKYMSYNTILSEQRMDTLIKEIAIEGEQVEKDAKRPDIAIILSNDPEKSSNLDVVIVELKKMGLDLAKKEEVESQLRQRARKLIKFYKNRVKRMWYYGIVDIMNDKEFIASIKEQKYVPIFSDGSAYYNEIRISEEEIPVGFYILDYQALLGDAEARNATFLRIIKEGFKQSNQVGD